MITLLRLRRGLFDAMREDLRRPHDHAAERVGFIYGPVAWLGDARALILPAAYEPVADDAYVDDPGVGARIDRGALRRAMQRVLSTGEACFHVHLHAHRGTPGFSAVDADMLRGFVPPLQVVGPAARHGGLVLSENAAAATSWCPARRALTPVRVAIVGSPLWLGVDLVEEASWR